MKRIRKQITALLLTLSMLLALGPVAVSAADSTNPDAAQEDREIQLDVTYQETNYEDWNGSTPANIFSGSGTYSVSTVAGKPAYVIGRLAEPSTISCVSVTYADTVADGHANRARVSRVYASTDGMQWDELGMLPSSLTGGQTYRVETASPVLYEYVKIEQAPTLAQYWYTLGGISVYTMEYADGSTICDVAFDSYAGGDFDAGSANAAKVFTYGNSDVWNSAEVVRPMWLVRLQGKLASPACGWPRTPRCLPGWSPRPWRAPRTGPIGRRSPRFLKSWTATP